MVKTQRSQYSLIMKGDKPQTIIKETVNILKGHYGSKAAKPIRRCFGLTVKLFNGKLEGYRKCNTNYHDLSHTMDVFLAAARILDGHVLVQGKKISDSGAIHLLMAALLHDVGYIQEKHDTEGTGAKYTLNHVERSMTFVLKNRGKLFLDEEGAEAVARIIQATDLNLDLRMLLYPFTEERLCGSILGSADLIGQMADRIYLEKLLHLYNEFREAGMPGFDTELDVLRNSSEFYKFSRNRLDGTFSSIGRYARIHFMKRHNIDENLYEKAIERNMAYRLKILSQADTSRNILSMLRRRSGVEEFYATMTTHAH
jgi:hypothetical protein